MPTPKRKLSKSRRDSRSANKGVKPKAITGCQTCQAPIATHQACQSCGYYKGRKILTTKADRLYTRGQAREEKEGKLRTIYQAKNDNGQGSAQQGE